MNLNKEYMSLALFLVLHNFVILKLFLKKYVG